MITETGNVYREAKHPFVKGQPREKIWRAILPPVVAQDDETWARRCRDYWERQERVYGVRMSDYTMLLDATQGLVYTRAVVLDVLPGQRI